MKLMLFYSYKNKWQFLLNIITAFVIAISILFIGLLISYWFFIPISGGSDMTFWDYLHFFFSGNWDVSTVIAPGMPVTELYSSSIFRTLEFLWIPIPIGVIIGICVGKASFKLRGKWANKVTQLFIAIGMTFPVFFLGILLQFNSYMGGEPHSTLMLLFGNLPTIGFKNPAYLDPTFITGFPILDARLSGELYLAIDRIEHLILPIFTLTPAIIAFVAWQTRSSMERKRSETSILSNTMKTVMIFGFIFSFYFLVDISFNLRMIGNRFLSAIFLNDVYVLIGGIFIILTLLVVLTFISNLVYSVVKFLKFDSKDALRMNSPPLQNNNMNPGENDLPSRRNIKKHLKYIPIYLYKYPFFFLGLIIMVVIVVLAIFPELISGYTLAEAQGFLPGSWEPPSPGHIWGTAKFGRDVFARVLYGTRDVLIFGFEAVLIGVAGGLVFGFISSLHRQVSKAIETVMIILFIIPVIFFLGLIWNNFGFNYWMTSLVGFPLDGLTLTMGCLLIPIFTRAITSVPLGKRNYMISLKKIVIYIPLAFGLIVLIYESLGFLGLTYSPPFITWGDDLAEARLFLQTAPWASLWPGLFIFITTFGFILLHYGLKNIFLDKWNLSILTENYRQIEV